MLKTGKNTLPLFFKKSKNNEQKDFIILNSSFIINFETIFFYLTLYLVVELISVDDANSDDISGFLSTNIHAPARLNLE